MKRTAVLIAFLSAVLLPVCAYCQQIGIDEINENEFIRGHVDGVLRTDTQDLRVVVYMHTDFWYIHPFVKSYAEIEADGTWELRTVQDEYERESPDKVAALIIDASIVPPRKLARVERLTHRAIDMRRLCRNTRELIHFCATR